MKRGWWAGKINVLAVASHGHRRSCSDTQRHRENATGGYRRWWLGGSGSSSHHPAADLATPAKVDLW
jgi:hypothetical protein